MNVPPLVSVVIPTFRRQTAVKHALDALTRQTLPSSAFEVVVAIDGSEDGTRELVTGYAAPFRLQALWQPNAGRAAAINAGIRRASGEVLVLLDDDMEPSAGCLAAHLSAHGAHDRLGVIGAAPIAAEANEPQVVTRHVAPKFNQHLEKLARPDYRPALRDFYTGNFSIRRSVLMSVGLFDEGFTLYGNEDLEVCLRLRRAGVTLIYDAAALARQHYTKDFNRLAQDTVAKGQTSVLLANKHPESLAELRLSTYHQASRPWRWLRGSLLALTRWWPALPDILVTLTRPLERWDVPGLPTWYRLCLDYLYWLGVQAARHQLCEANRYAASGLPEARP